MAENIMVWFFVHSPNKTKKKKEFSYKKQLCMRRSYKNSAHTMEKTVIQGSAEFVVVV